MEVDDEEEELELEQDEEEEEVQNSDEGELEDYDDIVNGPDCKANKQVQFIDNSKNKLK